MSGSVDLICLFLGFLNAVLGATATTFFNSLAVQGTTNDVITNAGKVLYTTTTNKNDRVFLQVVSFARNVHGDLFPVTQANTGNLSKSRVRLFRGHGTHLQANTLLLRALFKHWRLTLTLFQFPAFADKLVNCGHKTVVRVGLIHTMEYRTHAPLLGRSRVFLLEKTPFCRHSGHFYRAT